ncbi:DUF4827 domain-containing protein [Parabacteroides sp. OttesenSCG-928-G07]|nr:DUF4827 domain-containing protein [Parabacteroides sp. OttesenSCG-928-G21]MDL2277602.1 DUF4827 domain-containing protein [Parabacteroides sp. OttesenSCG-928-G07]
MKIYKNFSVVLVIVSAMIIASCSKTVTYTDMLKREKRAISQLRDEEGLDFIKEFPKDWKFKENQFVELSNGVYMNIIDSGNGVRATINETVVYARFTADYIMRDTSVTFKTLSNYGVSAGVTDPVEFKYGSFKPVFQSPSSALQVQLELLLSEGMQTGLQYVGHGGKVKLIVPFKVGSAQTSQANKPTSDQAAGQPVYFRIIQYRFADEL